MGNKLTKSQSKRFGKKMIKWMDKHGLVKTNADAILAWHLGATEAIQETEQHLADELARQKKRIYGKQARNINDG